MCMNDSRFSQSKKSAEHISVKAMYPIECRCLVINKTTWALKWNSAIYFNSHIRGNRLSHNDHICTRDDVSNFWRCATCEPIISGRRKCIARWIHAVVHSDFALSDPANVSVPHADPVRISAASRAFGFESSRWMIMYTVLTLIPKA